MEKAEPIEGRGIAGPVRPRLLDEAPPGLAALIAQNDPEAIRNAGYGVSVGIAESIAHRFVAYFFGGTFPDIAVLVA